MKNWAKTMVAVLGVVALMAACDSDSGGSSTTGGDVTTGSDGTDATDDSTDGTDDGTDGTDDGTDGTDDGTDGTDDGTDATDGGTDSTDGGMCESGGPDACVGAADLAILCDPDSTVQEDAQNCGLGCIGNADGAKCGCECVVTDTGLSNGCSYCFGETIACAIENCIGPCGVDPGSAACTQCRADNCDEAFDLCTGDFQAACAQ